MLKCRLLASKQASRLQKMFLDTGFHTFFSPITKPVVQMFTLVSFDFTWLCRRCVFFLFTKLFVTPPRPDTYCAEVFPTNTQFNRTYFSHPLSTCYAWLIRDWACGSRSSTERRNVSLASPWYEQLLFLYAQCRCRTIHCAMRCVAVWAIGIFFGSGEHAIYSCPWRWYCKQP
jgi:hypothetical protein